MPQVETQFFLSSEVAEEVNEGRTRFSVTLEPPMKLEGKSARLFVHSASVPYTTRNITAIVENLQGVHGVDFRDEADGGEEPRHGAEPDSEVVARQHPSAVAVFVEAQRPPRCCLGSMLLEELLDDLQIMNCFLQLFLYLQEH